MINKANVFIFSVLLFQIPGLLYAQEIPTTDSGTTAWMLTSTALVLLMIPGLAMFYGGLVRTKNVLGTMMHSFAAMAIIGVLWAVCGYSLSFGKNILGGWIGWDSNLLFLNGAYDAIDFAGGTVVHISAGISALVAALYLGSRRGYPKTAMQPNNLVMTLMGAGLLWVGWFGFNAGSSVSSDIDTARALTVTQIAAASGALTWMIIEGVKLGKATSLGVASGILAGLVAITPAAGVVQTEGALVLGAIASCICCAAISLKNRIGYDDSLDVFGIHGVAGIAGSIILTFFIRSSWMQETAVLAGGAWTVWQQLGVQVTAVVITIAYTAIFTIALLLFVQKTVGFRLEEQAEKAGMDSSLHGEHGYGLLNLN